MVRSQFVFKSIRTHFGQFVLILVNSYSVFGHFVLIFIKFSQLVLILVNSYSFWLNSYSSNIELLQFCCLRFKRSNILYPERYK